MRKTLSFTVDFKRKRIPGVKKADLGSIYEKFGRQKRSVAELKCSSQAGNRTGALSRAVSVAQPLRHVQMLR